jgi:hypothetical protein
MICSVSLEEIATSLFGGGNLFPHVSANDLRLYYLHLTSVLRFDFLLFTPTPLFELAHVLL